MVTAGILEFGDQYCNECCQKFFACGLGCANIANLAFLVLIIVLLTQPTDNDDASCPETNAATEFGAMGAATAAVIFFSLSIAACVVLSFIECCCDDAGKG